MNNRRSAFGLTIKDLEQTTTASSNKTSPTRSIIKVNLDQSYNYGDGEGVQEQTTTTVEISSTPKGLIVERISSDDPYDMFLESADATDKTKSNTEDIFASLVSANLANINIEKEELRKARLAATVTDGRVAPGLNRTAMKNYQRNTR